jgi:hypothetical protein
MIDWIDYSKKKLGVKSCIYTDVTDVIICYDARPDLCCSIYTLSPYESFNLAKDDLWFWMACQSVEQGLVGFQELHAKVSIQ